MANAEETLARLAGISNLTVFEGAPLSRYTRFGVGGPADVYAETADEAAFLAALAVARSSGLAFMVMGSGTNLIASDAGFRGIMLRFISSRIEGAENLVTADAGAALDDVVDFTISNGLKGLETLAGIPGSLGAAIYGNAGAYGHAMAECVARVRFFDGDSVRVLAREECAFRYRESVFKRHKGWIIFSAELLLEAADADVLKAAAAQIRETRNRKFPVTMKCAGSVFKNLILRELPAGAAARVPSAVVREGKVPAAWFLEQVGAKGMRSGDIRVAEYHANLLYNAGAGTAAELCVLIGELKARVRAEFGLDLEEEVQYVGFPHAGVVDREAYTSA
ncbi:MAG: UDP-N-acetylmuramate dehydrogenase [Acidobacteria bacterium]|nr:UDP-N-acetylmuramate dehydrogenase [Acidobacteriota bacterium]